LLVSHLVSALAPSQARLAAKEGGPIVNVPSQARLAAKEGCPIVNRESRKRKT
ncbi:unnamed protein product, partial [Pylaiella littoralis]